jgi:hypothetical protein
MKVEKNTVITLTLALVGLFSTAADARISGNQVVPMVDTVLAQASQGSDAVFNQCVREKFIMENANVTPPLLGKLYELTNRAAARGVIDDEQTLAILVNGALKKACSDSQLVGGGDKKLK